MVRTRARRLLVLRTGWPRRVLCREAAEEQVEDVEGEGEGERCRWWCWCCWDWGRGCCHRCRCCRPPGSGMWWGRVLVVEVTDSGMLHVLLGVVCLWLAGLGKVGFFGLGCGDAGGLFRGLFGGG